jgi:hypothetical protein
LVVPRYSMKALEVYFISAAPFSAVSLGSMRLR